MQKYFPRIGVSGTVQVWCRNLQSGRMLRIWQAVQVGTAGVVVGWVLWPAGTMQMSDADKDLQLGPQSQIPNLAHLFEILCVGQWFFVGTFKPFYLWISFIKSFCWS